MATKAQLDSLRTIFLILGILLFVVSIIRYRSALNTGESGTNNLQPTQQPAPSKPSPQSKPLRPRDSPSHTEQARQEQPVLTLSSISPDAGAIPGYKLLIRECHRTSDSIWCSAQVTNLTDARALLQTGSLGNSVDDEGNSAQVMFSAIQQSLMPGVATNLQFRIYDKHQSVKFVNLDLIVDWEIDGASYQHLIFKDVPVQ